MIKKSKKQAAIDRDYGEIVKQIVQEREPCCESCGRYGIPLSVSHIISRKRCKELGRIDLITDKDNLLLECFTESKNCHPRWEVRDIAACYNQKTFDYKIHFISQHDLYQFNVLIRKINAYLQNN